MHTGVAKSRERARIDREGGERAGDVDRSPAGVGLGGGDRGGQPAYAGQAILTASERFAAEPGETPPLIPARTMVYVPDERDLLERKGRRALLAGRAINAATGKVMAETTATTR